MNPSTIKITFGKPILVSELPKEERRFLAKHVQDIMQEMLDSYEA